MELKNRYKLMNAILLKVKMIIYANRNSSTDLQQVKMVMRDLFLPSFRGVWHPEYIISQFYIIILQSYTFSAKLSYCYSYILS